MLFPLPSQSAFAYSSVFSCCMLSLGSYEGLNDAAITSIFCN